MGLSLAFAFLLLPALLAGASDDDRLIGWQGETYNKKDDQAVAAPKSRDTPWIETIAWSPRAFVYHNFLSEAEVEHLVSIGSRRVSRSLVVDSQTGASKLDNIRTSFGGSFGRGEDPVIAALEQRIAEWTHLPAENGEPIQILRYMDGQKYDAHWDWFNDPVHQKQHLIDGNRYATVLMYLGEVEEGGETTLPLADAIDLEAQTLPNPSECAARMGIAIRPKKGDALLFFDMDIEGQKGDRKALHASCPTLKGTKWTATKWIHNKPYMGKFNALESAGRCTDTSRDCNQKVANGGCSSDPSLTGISGICRKSCGDCIVCPPNDVICQRGNMKGRYKPQITGHSQGGAPVL